MKAYVICIVVTLILNFFAEKFLKRDRKVKGIFLLFLSLIFLCTVAGARSITVGTDVNVYVSRLIVVCKESLGLFSYLRNANSDFLFALIIYISNLTNSTHFVLFMIEFAVAAPIYWYAYENREKNSLTLTILIFLLTMYCISLNLMRQSIAIAFSILAYHYFDKKNYKKSVILLIAASLFHKTALISVVAFCINKLIKSNFKYKIGIIFLSLFGLFLAGMFMDKIVMLTSYSRYLNMVNLMRSFSWLSLLKIIFWIVLGIFCYRFGNDKEHKENTIIAVVFLLISLVLTITSFKIPGTGRLGYYFLDLAYFIIVFEIPKAFKQRKFILAIIILILFALWWNMTAVDNDSSRVYPYESDVIDFLN